MEPTPAHPNRTAKLAFGLLAAFAGGLVGHFAFLWIARQGFYALALPGALAGLGCGLVSKQNCLPVAFACGGWALAVGVFSEWRFAPFTKDASLGYFLTQMMASVFTPDQVDAGRQYVLANAIPRGPGTKALMSSSGISGLRAGQCGISG